MEISRYDFTEDEIKSLQITSGEMVNIITLSYAYDFNGNKFRGAITKRNPLSVLIYGEAPKALELHMIQGTRQAEKIADAILMTSSIPEIIVSFSCVDLRSMLCEVGDLITLTHRAGIGAGGFTSAQAVIAKARGGKALWYEVVMKPSGSLYQSELVNLSAVSMASKESLSITYENGVATLTIYADTQGSPPVEGAEVTINNVKKVTDKKGQVRFNLVPGTYKAIIHAGGYEDSEVIFQL